MSAAKMVYQALVRSKELTQLLAHGKKGIIDRFVLYCS